MNKQTIRNGVLYSLLALGVLSVSGVGVALAANNTGGNGNGLKSEKWAGGDGPGKHQMMGFGGGDELIPADLREELRADFKNLTADDKKALFESRREQMDEHRQAFEAFTGISKEEMKSLHQSGKSLGDILTDSGKTENDVKNFLTTQFNSRIDMIVKQHSLSSDQEQTLRDRVSDAVEKTLSRLFK